MENEKKLRWEGEEADLAELMRRRRRVVVETRSPKPKEEDLLDGAAGAQPPSTQ